MKKSLYRQVMFVISSICLILLITIAVKIGVFSELTSCVWIESILSVINNSYFSGVLCSIIAVIVIYFFQVQYSKRMLKKDVRCNEIIQDVYDGIEKYCNISNTIPERTSKNEEKDYSKRQIADGLMYYKFYKEYEVDFEMMAYSLSCENNDILIKDNFDESLRVYIQSQEYTRLKQQEDRLLSYLQAGLSDMQKQQLGAYMDATTEVHSALASQDYVNGVVDGIALREKVTAK